MIQIIPENRRTSGKEKFAQTINNLMSRGAAGISEYGQMQRQNEMQALEDKKLEEILGQDVSGLSPEMKKVAFQQIMQGQQAQQESQFKSQQKAQELAGKRQESLAPLQAGLETINEMEKIGKRGNLGRGSSIIGAFGGQTSKDRAAYERLGKSLISLSTNIPIRNKAEFEALAHDLYDPSLPDSAREGILNSMKNIIRRNMSKYQGGEEELGMQENAFSPPNLPSFGQSQQQRPPLTAFMR